MTTLKFLQNQVIETRKFTQKLILEMPEDLWFTISNKTNSNFAWQIGHIFMAQNFHILACSLGRNPQVSEKMPIQDYANVFRGLGSMDRSVDKSYISCEKLKENFDFIYNLCLEQLDKASDEILLQPLNPIPFKHPVANTKYEAISWSFKHEMWHCAEMEQIKISLEKQFKWIG